jgi:hypothetical protein
LKAVLVRHGRIRVHVGIAGKGAVVDRVPVPCEDDEVKRGARAQVVDDRDNVIGSWHWETARHKVVLHIDDKQRAPAGLMGVRRGVQV